MSIKNGKNKLLLILITPLLLISHEITVSSNSKVKTIKEALTLAVDGDTITILSGTYFEHDLMLDKAVVIRGIGFPIIDGSFKHKILTINSKFVHVEGIQFQNVGNSFIDDQAAIKINNARSGKVINNKLINTFFGIYLARSANVLVENNSIASNAVRETTSGNGIHLWYCKNMTIKNNEISGHRDGIYLEFVEESHIESNFSHENLRYGLHFMFSHHCKYIENTFENNGSGVAVMFSNFVTMYKNKFRQNWGPSSFGLLLKEIYDSDINENIFEENTVAIFAEACNRLYIHKNNFVRNGYGIKIMANSMDCRILQNNFISNTFSVGTNSRQNFSLFDSNYWSEYNGYDLDKDGIGDIPYSPVKLFAIVSAKQPIVMVLYRSLFVNFLEMSEEIFPSLTPETLRDENPLMKKIQ